MDRISNDRLKLQLRNDIDSILTKAIEEQRFQMYYQPIYSIEKQKFLSAEALIRLYDDTYGFISPELFITAAERNGTILQIGDYILDEVCRFLERCGKERIPLDYIEINLSMVQCMQQEMVEKVQFYLNKYNLKPDQINLEITETAASTAQDIVEDNIQKLSKQGISFSLDDYGTGYSNISRIISLPFHIVKLDKSLTDKVEDPKMKTLLKNTICMLKEIGMKIVVEGVETQETLEQFVNLKASHRRCQNTDIVHVRLRRISVTVTVHTQTVHDINIQNIAFLRPQPDGNVLDRTAEACHGMAFKVGQYQMYQI